MLYVFYKIEFLDYVFYVFFLKRHFKKKRKKSRFLDSQKRNVKTYSRTMPRPR